MILWFQSLTQNQWNSARPRFTPTLTSGGVLQPGMALATDLEQTARIGG